MKIPLDHVCVRTGVLCPRCRRLVESGEVEPFEVDVMRELLNLEGKGDFKFLKDAEYVKAIRTRDMLVLVIDIKDTNIHPRLLGRLGRILSSKLKVKVRVVNRAHGDLREIARQLVYPARVIGVNTLWLPDGTVEHIVRIPRSDSRYLPSNVAVLEDLLSKITGMNVRIRTGI